MSLALHLSADALADLRRLEPWFQEEVLDEIDRIATNPALIPPPLAGWGSIHAFAREHEGALYVVTIVLAIAGGGQHLSIHGINVYLTS